MIGYQIKFVLLQQKGRRTEMKRAIMIGQATYLQALEQLAHQQGLNIRFTDIRPGFVDTDLLNGDFRYPMLMKPEKVAREIVAVSLIGAIGY